MALPHNDDLQPLAHRLRKAMTKEERLLWYGYLRSCPVKFYRQRIIGNYILDFYSSKAKLAIELDGSQHFEPIAAQFDAQRTTFLNSLGIEVLRFSNADVHRNFDGVCQTILERINHVSTRD